MTDDLSKDLLKAAIALKSERKKGSKLIKKIVKNVLPDYSKWKTHNVELSTISLFIF